MFGLIVTFVYMFVKKNDSMNYALLGEVGGPWFWRDFTGHEVDVII